jgi:predicted Zn-dependent protease
MLIRIWRRLVDMKVVALQRLGTRLRASVAVFALATCTLAATAFAAPYKPAAQDEVLLKLDAAQRQASAQLREVNDNARNISDANVAAETARKFVALGRAQHDERFFGYASAALQPWRNDPQAPTPIVLLRADIAQHQHRFGDALQILDPLIAREPNSPDARLMRAALYMTQGRPLAAKVDCQRLFALRDSFAATVCLAHAASMNGQLNSSYRLVDNLLKQFSADEHNSQYAWALGVAAEMAERLGDHDAAEQLLRKALVVNPDDLVSRLELCDLLLQNNHPQEVPSLLTSLLPSDPVLLRLALAAKRSGDAAQTNRAFTAWQASVERSAQLGVTLHLRELARGQLELLNAPQVALATALKNWQVQREPADARLLARAARAANNFDALQRVRAWQQELKLEDASLAL